MLGEGTIRREEALGVPWGLEALPAPRALPRRLVRGLGAMVQLALLAVLYPRSQLLLGGTIARALVREDHPRNRPAALEPLAEERLSGVLLPAAVDQHSQDVAILIDGPPAVGPRAVDGAQDFVPVPRGTGAGTPAPEMMGLRLPKLAAPLAEGFGGDDEATGQEHLFDVTGTQTEAEVQPDPMADNLGREAVVLVAVRT